MPIKNGEDDLIAWLYSFTLKGIKLDLENTKELLANVGDPHLNMKCIHVGGTDGKGSICSCISSILIDSGIRTGLYTSPHIEEFNERMTVNGEKISNEELSALARELRPIVDVMEEAGRHPTFFEITTVMAFMHFRNKGVEYAVIEVGMGGRLDSTNVIIPEVCVIGNISMDHESFLGDTLEKITYEKAGIIKPGVPCVTLNGDRQFKVLKEKADEVNAQLIRLDPKDIIVQKISEKGTEFLYKEEEYSVSIPGSRQADNAAMAIEAVSKLKIFGQCVRCNIKKGLADVRWPCRLEKIDGIPLVIDVTHTAAGSKMLADDVKTIYGKVDVILGMLEDKDIDSMIDDLSKISDRIFVSKLRTERTADPKIIETSAKRRFKEVTLCNGISEAMDEAFKTQRREILVTGSFHTAEEALEWLKKTYAGYWTYSQRNMTEEHTREDRRKA